MAERAERTAHTVLRTIAVITLVDIGASIAGDRYYLSYEHRIANSPLGGTLMLWSALMPLLLAVFVGFEFWWVRRKKLSAKEVGVDAVLAAACLLALCLLALYAFTHYTAI